jgi:hypothetical protein
MEKYIFLLYCLFFNLIIFTAIFSFITGLEIDFNLIGSVDAMSDSGNTGNTFSTPNDDVAGCEHRSKDRMPVADCDDYYNHPVNCNFCDGPALNGTEGQSAIICDGCGAAICENCNAPNSDSDNDSGFGEE